MLPRIRLRRGRDRRLRSGHLWVYSNEIQAHDDPPAVGSLVQLEDHRGRYLATAGYHPNALIAARVWSRDEAEAVDEALLASRLERAARRRATLVPGWEAHRLVHAEADHMPGVVVDRYGSLAVIQSTSAFADTLTGTVARLLHRDHGCSAVLLRNDARGRQLEGLESTVEPLIGDVPRRAAVDEGGVRVHFDPRGGQKTGLFLDMRANRDRVCEWAGQGRVLDLYSYVGTIGVRAAAAGAAKATCVDSSEPACELARSNAETAGVAQRVEVVRADVRDVLKEIEPASCDLVICDPPGLIQRKKDVSKGVSTLRRLVYLALRAVAPGGLLVSASCSYHLTRDKHCEVVEGAARRQGRTVRRVFRGSSGPDHPLLPAHPQTDYLDCMVYLVEGTPLGH